MGGEDEMELIRKVPLFLNLDDLILDDICDRVKPVVTRRFAISAVQQIIREGDRRMSFIIRGHVKREQGLSKGMMATSVLERGGFLGDKLLSWCLRHPFLDRLPSSSATFICIDSVEGFSLDTNHIQYITDHFLNKFANERLKWMTRYYSSNWCTWEAVNIQLG